MSPSSLRIAYLISRYPAISHTFILREVLELRRLGIEIGVASINDVDRPSSLLTADERAEKETVFYVKKAGVTGAVRAHVKAVLASPVRYFQGAWFALRLGGSDLRRIVMSLLYFAEAVMVGEWMRRRRFRHLHVHFATPAATVALIMTRTFPFTLSITVHGPDEFYDVPGYLLEEKIRGSRLLCAIGLFARSQLMKISPASEWSKIEVTPLGVDSGLFAPRSSCAAGDPFEILCVGRLTPAKGQHILVSAVRRLHAEDRRVRLRLIGDGPDRAALEQAVRDAGLAGHVFLEGAVNQDRIRDFYREADVFALASFAEGIPVVLMEAMAMEIPCVTTWITGIPELIRDSIDGLLVPPSDDIALAAAIARLMDDPGLRRRLGEAGRRRIIDKYDLRANVEKLAQVYRTHLAELGA